MIRKLVAGRFRHLLQLETLVGEVSYAPVESDVFFGQLLLQEAEKCLCKLGGSEGS